MVICVTLINNCSAKSELKNLSENIDVHYNAVVGGISECVALYL